MLIHLEVNLFLWYDLRRGDTMFLFFFNDNYTAVIGDIIDSKKSGDRNTIQKNLKEVLEHINEKYQDCLASKFMITLGDEFQGLLKDRNMVMTIINEIEMLMFPVQIRFGIGIGSINTDINFNNSIEIDGPAYNRARRMINTLQKKKFQYEEAYSNIMLCSEDENEEIDYLINSVLSVCSALKRNWSKRQAEIITVFIECGENQYKAAEALKITQSSVSKALKNSNYYTYRAAIKNIDNFLSKERKKPND